MHHLSYSVTGTCLTGILINPSHKCLSFCQCPFIQTYGSNWFLILFSVETSFSHVLDQYTWYKHHACHAGKQSHVWLWITVRPVPKRTFAFRYIESLGQESHDSWLSSENVRLPNKKNRLSRAVRTSNIRGLCLWLIVLCIFLTFGYVCL